MVAAVFSSWSMRSRELPEMPPGPSQDFFCSAALQLLLQQCEQVPSSHRGEKWLGRGHQVGMTRLRQLTCTSLNSIRYLQALILLGKAKKGFTLRPKRAWSRWELVVPYLLWRGQTAWGRRQGCILECRTLLTHFSHHT